MAGFSFEMPARAYAELRLLATSTKLPMAHFTREAVKRFLESSDVRAQIKSINSQRAVSS